MLNRAASYFGSLRGNARVCILCHPFWSVPFTLYYYYLSLYLKEAGVTDGQIGSLMVAGTVASLVFSLVAAPVVDRLGRKRATLVFDLLSSALPPLLYFLSGSFWVAMLATVLYNTNKIMGVAYYLVMIEDADDGQRAVALNLFNIITYAAGLLMPLAGLLVARHGVTRVERVFLLASFFIMTLMILARDRLLRETAEGRRQMAATAGRAAFSPRAFYRPYLDSLRFLKGQRRALYVLLANVFFFAFMTLGTNQSLYFTLFFIRNFGLEGQPLSLVGGLFSGGMLLAMVLINPLIRLDRLYHSLKLGSLVLSAGMGLLLVLPARTGLLVLLPVLMMSVSYGTTKTGLDSAMAIATQGPARSGLYALTNLLSSLVGILTAALVAALFPDAPGVLYQVCLALGLLVCLCVWLAGREHMAAEETLPG